jgi:hypothetical protein
MHISLQKLLVNKHSIRISSLLIGFLLWSTISDLHKDSITVRIPLCLYGEQAKTWEIPEQVTVTLYAKKSVLRAIDLTTLAAHINADTLTNKQTRIALTNKDLLLPNNVVVTNYSPLNLSAQRST